MTLAPKRYPKPIHATRNARNGQAPDAWLAWQFVHGVNGALAYRRKLFLNATAPLGTAGFTATTTVYRARMRTGLAVSELVFDFVMGLGRVAGMAGNPEPYVEVSVTPSGGAATTKSFSYGDNTGTYTDDELFTQGNVQLRFDVDAATTYEIAVLVYEGARIINVVGYEYADPEIDSAVDYYIEHHPTVNLPIDDAHRERWLAGASNIWLENGAHLFTWPGTGTGVAVSQTGTTLKNVIDNSSTGAPGAATPGYHFGSAGTGASALSNLLPCVRDSHGDVLRVTLCAYANATAAGGELWLTDGTRLGLINTINTTLQWYSVDTTLADMDEGTLALGKLDLQIKHGTAGQTVNVYAVSCYLRSA